MERIHASIISKIAQTRRIWNPKLNPIMSVGEETFGIYELSESNWRE